ncbi:MAG: hypothetical protein IKD47_01635 [Clostridia bacterium]|nr:hypothetical protein [Clostridia bacterium]
MKNKKETEKTKQDEIVYIDDNRTVADMNVEGMPWYVKGGYDKKKSPDKLSFKERFALVFGAYRAYLPVVAVIGGAFLLVFLLFRVMWG